MNRFIYATITLITLSVANTAQAAEHIVKVMTDYENMRMYFEPKTLIVDPGDTVTWVNQDDEEHNMVTYPDGFPKGAEGFRSPYLSKKGEKWSYTFKSPGTYDYHCIPHVFMGMHGSIIVGWASAPGEHHIPTEAETTAYRDELLRFFDEEEFEHAPHYVQLKQRAAKENCKCEK